MIILSFNPQFAIGELVSPKVDTDDSYAVLGYKINCVKNGEVVQFDYCCRGKVGFVDFDSCEVVESMLNETYKLRQ